MRHLNNAALTTLAAATVGNLFPSDIDALSDFLDRIKAGRAPDYANGTGETNITTLISNLNGLNP